MKIFLYLILAVFLLSIAVTPLVEVFLAGRDRLVLSSTLHNSSRAAREASYAYLAMRDIDAVADEETFLRYFAETFAASYGMGCKNPAANPLKFVSPDGAYNDFDVFVAFQTEYGDGGAILTTVTVTAESEYRFRTAYMRLIGYGDTHPYMLRGTNTYTMRVTN